MMMLLHMCKDFCREILTVSLLGNKFEIISNFSLFSVSLEPIISYMKISFKHMFPNLSKNLSKIHYMNHFPAEKLFKFEFTTTISHKSCFLTPQKLATDCN